MVGTRTVDFDFVAATRDGQPENSRVERRAERVRIYLGKRDVFLPTGEYTYTITYRTGRQVRFFDTHDELYWNVTGNAWAFPIVRAEAVINLPPGVQATDTAYYTGPYGSTAQDARAARFDDGNIVKFETTRPLGVREGLTVAVKMPKGSIAPPTFEDEARWFFKDFRAELIASLGLVLIGLYYFWTWNPGWTRSAGRCGGSAMGTAGGPVTGAGQLHRQEGPFRQGLECHIGGNPESGRQRVGEARYVCPGSDGHRSETDDQPLPVGEASLLNRFHGSDTGEFKVTKSNGKAVKALQEGFSRAMEREHRGRYYRHNTWRVVFGVVLSLATILALLVFGNSSTDLLVVLIPVGMTCLIATVLISRAVVAFTSGSSLRRRITSVIGLVIAGFVILSSGFPAVSEFAGLISHPIVVTAVAGIIVLNVLFFFLLGAPTRLGRQKMDEIEGLKLYLDLAEKDRMNLRGAPEMSPAHYETLLPYAVALGLEKPWSKAFQSWLTTAIAAGAVASSWSPGWYHGRDFSADRIGDTMSSIPDAMQGSFAEAMPVPKSSSSGFSGGGGGGGGFSGGGGGGGGGGGW